MKNRVVSFSRVKASQLLVNPDNVRFHPPEQMAQMAALLDEIGMADAIIVRQTAQGYQVLDGHMRRQLLSDELVPVIVVDLGDEESYSFLLTFDAIKAMATRDASRVNNLLDKVFAETALVREMLDKMSSGTEKALAMPKGNAQTRAQPDSIIVGKYRILLTQEESSKLCQLARQYADTTGSYQNFISHLLERVKKNRARLQLSTGGAPGSGVQPEVHQPREAGQALGVDPALRDHQADHLQARRSHRRRPPKDQGPAS
jgi:hypothetical protein